MNRRLLLTIAHDMRLQFRNGFYYAALAVALLAVLIFGRLDDDTLIWLLPVFLLGNLLMNTFYFMGGLVLLEKGEGTLSAQVVSPLRDWEYLIAKVISLALLATLENCLIVLLTVGWPHNWPALLAGLGLVSAVYALFGFVVVIRYQAVNEYLLPSIFWALLLSLPSLTYLAVGQHWLLALHPLQGALWLFEAAYAPAAAGRLLFAVAYGGFWVALALWLARQRFRTFVITN